MNWRLRFREWLTALATARRTAGKIPWLTLVLALLSGIVPRRVWRSRIRRCFTCPLFTKDGFRCRGAIKAFEVWGCDCYIPFSALTAEPYEGGCYGRAKFSGEFGWGAYKYPWYAIRLLPLLPIVFDIGRHWAKNRLTTIFRSL